MLFSVETRNLSSHNSPSPAPYSPSLISLGDLEGRGTESYVWLTVVILKQLQLVSVLEPSSTVIGAGCLPSYVSGTGSLSQDGHV